ncbi:protein SOSEKI 4-like [Triticum urartu]|uniref:SOSEKI DIX-like domain-containing protein n=1 Tax=Triticum urartu TaxID=4572 RepID=A0A8R7TZU4_TRIUA|nr:protein UPSTREAM OF FLC-like [Triticum dicoccoides]XP_048565087.1 protein SOSEKI 4-like [Triticum urartu]
MAVVVAGGGGGGGGGRARAEQQPRPHWREQQGQRSPDMAAVPRPPRPRPGPARVAVVYYLSRNGQLEHPHFMEVALSSPDGLYLRDVIDRLDALRGKGMARMYSWASKRSYRNGFVWHDLADDDYVHPVGGREYVLKGTERLHPPAIHLPLLDAAAASSCSSGSHDTTTSSSSGWEHGHRKGVAGACGTAEVGEYRVYKAEDRAAAAADAATQTEDGHRGRSRGHQRRAQEELSREETSPPTASTSPETLEALIRADGRVLATVPSGANRARASSVLMQLISCGSVSVKGGLATPVLPRGVHYRPRPPRPPARAAAETAVYRQKAVEDKEYFSGSLVETQRPAADPCQDLAVLRRSSSDNADRAGKAEEAVDLHDRCIPRKPKSKKDGYQVISCTAAHASGKRVGA